MLKKISYVIFRSWKGLCQFVFLKQEWIRSNYPQCDVIYGRPKVRAMRQTKTRNFLFLMFQIVSCSLVKRIEGLKISSWENDVFSNNGEPRKNDEVLISPTFYELIFFTNFILNKNTNVNCKNRKKTVGVNFINKLFVWTLFFYAHVTRKKLPKRCLYVKRARIMLMKLTIDKSFKLKKQVVKCWWNWYLFVTLSSENYELSFYMLTIYVTILRN